MGIFASISLTIIEFPDLRVRVTDTDHLILIFKNLILIENIPNAV